jgi:small conductance mechanosensitive channel
MTDHRARLLSTLTFATTIACAALVWAGGRSIDLGGALRCSAHFGLDHSLEVDEKRLAELKATLNEPDHESAEAQSEFEELDAQLIAKREQHDQLPKTTPPQDERRLRDEISALEKKWTLARDRFDLAIRDRKATRESVTALEKKIEHDRQALEELRGAAAQTNPSTTPAPAVLPEPATPVGSAPAAAPTAAKPAAEASKPTKPEPAANKEPENEQDAATAEAKKADAAADEAEHEEQSIEERIEILKTNVKVLAGEPVTDLKHDVEEAGQRVREAARQLDEMQSSLAALQAEELAAASEADQKRQADDEADAVVKELNNPFTVHNLLQWLLDHGPRILGLLLAVGVALRLSRMIEARLVSLVASRGRIGNRQERENRAKTLLGIFHNAANIVILGGGIVALLDEVGIPVAPLIGGAAVIGLAAAFGAQSLIKDYFTGFLVLLEQQYLVNDVVKIGAISGQVERITLRTTTLRDTEGHLHFIPHGQITTVTNTTHGWARAVFEIRVSYRENVDHVIELLTQLARELAATDPFRGMILEEPVTPGVDSLTDNGVIIKFNVKTRPLHVRPVKRELLRRIKNKFDEQGIEIPHPQLMIYRRDDNKLGVVADKPERRAG